MDIVNFSSRLPPSLTEAFNASFRTPRMASRRRRYDD